MPERRSAPATALQAFVWIIFVYDRRIRNAYAMTGYAEAKGELKKLFRQLERMNPSAARSLEEGLEETLTVHRLGVGELLRRGLATTNPIESCLSTVERVARNVKLARRRSAAALDGHRVAGSGTKIPQSERLSPAGQLASHTQPFVDSAGPGRVTCTKSRAAAFN